jgi:catechol 2,3-dioxygenase-like lactoylglutathione lyase family enzyme
LGGVHYVRILVSDVARSKAFYTEVLGFEVAYDVLPPREHGEAGAKAPLGGVILRHEGILFGLRPADEAGDRSGSPTHVGLDRLAFSVASRAELERALRMFDERGVRHGGIQELPSFGVSYFPFFDPDGLAFELTAPIADGST